jgi:hypothetical protein
VYKAKTHMKNKEAHMKSKESHTIKRGKTKKPCTVLAEGTGTFEGSVEAALPYLIDGEGDYLELNFRFHGLKHWRVLRIDDLLGFRSALRKMHFVGGDWVCLVGCEVMHIYREGKRAIQDYRVATIEVAGRNFKRQRVVRRVLLGD